MDNCLKCGESPVFPNYLMRRSKRDGGPICGACFEGKPQVGALLGSGGRATRLVSGPASMMEKSE